MNNRLAPTLNVARKQKKKIFCAYLTLGFPDLSVTKRAIQEFERAGVDIIELGFPFSDPLADGPTIQYASEQAIKKGVHLKNAFQMVKDLRKKGLQIPILLFSYVNPMLHLGVKTIAKQLKSSGFDGAIIPDLTPDEASEWKDAFQKNRLSLVFLVAPTTRKERMREIARKSADFIYYVSLRGVTGARNKLPADLARNIKAFKRMTEKPVLVGFGVSQPVHAKAISKTADGVIVGSALVEHLKKGRAGVRSASRLITRMISAMRQSRS